MKKLLTYTILIAIAAAAVFAIYRFNFRKSIAADAPVSEQIAAILQQNGCMDCHDKQAVKPFYGDWPVAKQMLTTHIENGSRSTDLRVVAADLDNISEAELAKIEQTAITGSMPIFSYKIAHWGTGFNDEEKAAILAWAKQYRAEHFSNGLAAPEFANEPVQPIPDYIAVNAEKVALGYDLYNDGRLSHDGTITCATCHILAENGADDADTRTSEGINGQFGGVNAPTVYNSVFNFVQFWDGRAENLAQQAAGPPVNPVEMGCSSFDEICARLLADKTMVARFKKLYPEEGITEATITDAIAEFEKTLLTPNSPFDKYLKGDKTALTADAREGYEIFKQHNCATCHVGVILGGQSYEHIGIVADYFAARSADITPNEEDGGHYKVTKDENDRGKFKTPGLRNVALTPPYMHDGSVATLDGATKVMLDFQSDNTYTQDEVDKMVAFMESLTGENRFLQSGSVAKN